MLSPRRLSAFRSACVARTAVVLASVLAGALPLHAQSQAINGTIEGVVRDGTGAVLPGATVTVSNVETGQQRAVTTDSAGEYRAPLLSLGAYRVKAELQGFKTVERTRGHAERGADRRHQLRDGGRRRGGGGVRLRRGARFRAGEDRPRADDRRGGDPEPSSRLAQPLQLRVPAAQRDGLRERGVRGAPHQRQRHADAHELPDRRQHQHREGPRRAAPAAGLGDHGPRGQGHHQRLRPRVRADDGHGLQRRHAVRDQRPPRLGQRPLPPQGHVRPGPSS